MTGFPLATPGFRGVALAAVALAAMLAISPARAEMRDFTCTAEQLGGRLTTAPTGFHKSGNTPVSKTFTGRPQVQRPGRPVPVAVETSCELKPSLHHYGNGFDIRSGRISAIDGQYHMVVQCTARPEGGAARAGIERRLSLPAPAAGGPFDSPPARSRFEEAACQAVRSALITATMVGR